MNRLTLEIASDGVGSALAAQAGGADRVELCANLTSGGTTPSAGTIGAARAALTIPLHVLIRPRAGDFVFSAGEREAMRRDIAQCARLGCDGVVIGALDAAGEIDVAACRELVAAAGTLAVTFHRAFDLAHEASTALETIIGLGCSRLLTSGGRPSAHEGAAVIAALVDQAQSRIGIVAGGGIRPKLIAELVRVTGVREVHASAAALRTSASAHRHPALRGLEPDWHETDPERVKELAAALRAAEAAAMVTIAAHR